MGIRDTKMEAELEKNIIDYLQEKQGYRYIKADEMKLAFNRKYSLDEVRLLEFIEKSQPRIFKELNLDIESKKESFLKQLDLCIRKDGIISVLKNGINHYPATSTIPLFYHALDGNRESSYKEFEQNIFSVTNQLTFSERNKGLELDIAIFINGLPIITMELKSRASSTGWTYKDAEEQYKNDRKPIEPLFSFKRCMAHFAVDENFITFTTKLDDKNTVFMPFNKGIENGGSGNPVNPNGTMTDYLWKDFLDKKVLTSLIKDFSYVDNNKVLVFPRYHQYRVVTKLVEDVMKNGVGKNYLIQHSAGSGKSNSITWLAYRLVEVARKVQNGDISKFEKIFNSVIVVTDRLNLDKQIDDNIRKFIDVRSVVGHASSSTDLKNLLVNEKKIIIATIQKFPYLLEKIGTELKGKNFAIIIDEAHSSQSGRAAASLNMAVSATIDINDDNDFEIEDKLNELIEARKMPENASFFAFTATPKAKTLQMFGNVFDLYSMKQAIEEGFILDVLKNYTYYENFYKIKKSVEDNPIFDKKKAQKKIRKYVEYQEFPIREKAEVMVEHFLHNTATKIAGQAKAMVVTQSILSAIEYYHCINDMLKKSNTGYEALIAFSGEKEYNGKTVTEASLNGFPDNETVTKFKEAKYKFLIVADKYQTGYDEPLLHTMYVDKVLNDVKAVQTLSRLNRCTKNKIDTCIIDFANKPEHIQEAFQPYYKETKLDGEVDPNKLFNLLGVLDSKYVYEKDEVDELVELFLKNCSRDKIDNIIDVAVERYNALSEEDQVEFKSGVKSFIRTYNFLASILVVGQIEWEKKVIFFEHLIHRLPTPTEDLAKGILETIDLESYRLEKKNTIDIILEDKDGAIEGAGIGAVKKSEVELIPLENIVSTFNDVFGNIEWKDKDNVIRQIKELPEMVMKNDKFKNALKNSDLENIKREYSIALRDVFKNIMKDNMELFGQWTNNSDFKNWIDNAIFEEIMALRN